MSYSLAEIDISPRKEAQFFNKKIYSVEELAAFFPRKYYDFRKQKTVADCGEGEYCAMTGVLKRLDDGDKRVLRASFVDLNGFTFGVNWFHSSWMANRLRIGQTYTVCGKTTYYYGHWYINGPIACSDNPSQVAKLLPVYSKIKGMSDDYLRESIEKAVAYMRVNYVPQKKDLFARKIGLEDLFAAYQHLHSPADEQQYRDGRRRMDFEQIYDFYENLGNKSRFLKPVPGFSMVKSEKTEGFIRNLPFSLTEGQKEAIDKVREVIDNGSRMEALITGDVGCGKTIVAMILAMLAWENDGQTCIMAPTQVLAKQHMQEFSSRLEKYGICCGLLTGETKKRERTKLLKDLKTGNVHILIGTHAVLSEDVEFSKLALTVIDEEHKFGVAQKKRIEKMDENGVHHISMTATPIPRSLAMTIYGNNIHVIQITTLPKGRKPIITRVAETEEKGFAGLVEEVEKGHQAYVICPFINESDSERFQDVAAVQTVVDSLRKYCKDAGKGYIRVECISGDMKQADVLSIIDRFANKDIDILVSTTIVEVGVNVPNATAILVMSAERFGLAALHQLRGRVGRCSDQAYCFLFSEREDPKFELLCTTTDGFVVAEEDLARRGPGNLIGSEQTGFSKAIELILARPKMAALIRQELHV